MEPPVGMPVTRTFEPDSKETAAVLLNVAVPGAVSAISKTALDLTVTAEVPLPLRANAPSCTVEAPV